MLKDLVDAARGKRGVATGGMGRGRERALPEATAKMHG